MDIGIKDIIYIGVLIFTAGSAVGGWVFTIRRYATDHATLREESTEIKDAMAELKDEITKHKADLQAHVNEPLMKTWEKRLEKVETKVEEGFKEQTHFFTKISTQIAALTARVEAKA